MLQNNVPEQEFGSVQINVLEDSSSSRILPTAYDVKNAEEEKKEEEEGRSTQK
jgi:hypothetical protein